MKRHKYLSHLSHYHTFTYHLDECVLINLKCLRATLLAIENFCLPNSLTYSRFYLLHFFFTNGDSIILPYLIGLYLIAAIFLMSAFMDTIDKNCVVVPSGLHGDGVIMKKQVDGPGEVLFEEVPTLFLQSLTNRGDNIVCGGCKSFVGSLNLHIDLLTRSITRQDQEDLGARSMCGASSSGLGIGQFSDNKMLSPVMLCMHACGEVYCSEECRVHHWNDGHCLLCTGLPHITEDEALVQFKIHAVQSNEIFLMVADLFARVCIHVEQRVEDGDSRSPGEIASEMLYQYDSYVREQWWDAAIAPSGQDPVELTDSLKELVRDSWALANSALKLDARGLMEVLSEEYMSRTIGMFEQNNVGVRLNSPLSDTVAQLVPGNPSNKTFSSAAQLISLALEEADCEEDDCEEGESGEDEGEDEEEQTVLTGDVALDTLHTVLDENGSDNIFPPLDGAAFFMRICKINHSCEPNVRVEYISRGVGLQQGQGLRARMVSLRAISEGEELVQSYVDQNMPYVDRLKALVDYGFQCSCAKCRKEGA